MRRWRVLSCLLIIVVLLVISYPAY
ncbi:hypothetical protein [Escherichia coli]